MPKQSKIKSSKPGKATPVREREADRFYCTRCTRSFNRQRNNFPASQSPIFKENSGYLPVCRHCIDEMYEHYKSVLKDEKAAIRRICMKFDIYWSDRVYDAISKTSTTNSRVLSYISKSNLRQFEGQTYDDTLDEELQKKLDEQNNYQISIDSSLIGDDDEGETEKIIIPQESIDFWGEGLPLGYYPELDKRYKYWCGESDGERDVGEMAVIKQICMLEVTINHDTAMGKPIDRNVNALNTLLGSANLKPSQKKTEEETDSNFDKTPFGVGIKMYENSHPIPQPDPELQDADGIVKKITIWFLGHICSMLGIKNSQSKMYENELDKLRVEHPELDDEDDEVFFANIFGDDVDGT